MGHPGIVKMKQFARSYVWWPNIDAHIEAKVRGCSACQMNARNTSKQAVYHWPISQRKLERIYIDYAQFNYNHNKPEAFVTSLRQIELATEALIKVSQLPDWQDVLLQFRNFRELDRIIYPFEYLTNLSSKDIIQTIRISPNDAQRGFGENKKLEDKLSGETLYAFGVEKCVE